MGQVAELAVHGDEPFGLGDGNKGFEFALLRMTGDMHVGQS